MRDNFNKTTKQALGELVNFKCVRPACGRLTRGPSEDRGSVVNVGHAAHVTAVSKSGPRYDDTLTPEQRRAIDNGAHLCATCATLVDRDPDAYPPDKLKEWQRNGVELARRQLVQPVRYGVANTASVNAEVRNFLQRCERFRVGHIDEFTVFFERDLLPAHELLMACKWDYREPNGGGRFSGWQAGDTLHAQDSHAVNIQVEILSSLAELLAHIERPDYGWYFDRDFSVYRIDGMANYGYVNRFDDEQRRTIESTVEQTRKFVMSYQEAEASLKRYVSEDNTFTSI